jgi:hypothetical protein
MSSNNRAELSDRIRTLDILYCKIDACFHQNFKLVDESGTGFIVEGKCHYEILACDANKFKMWKREFKAELSDILELMADHKPSFFDTEDNRRTDELHKKKVSELSRNYDSLNALTERIPIRVI